jgi:hypothetical protein
VNELETLNDNELAERYHRNVKWRKQLEDALQKHPDYIQAGAEIEEITKILTQRLHDTGASSINTPNGTIHTVGKTTARIMDPEAFRGYVIGMKAWDMLDWKANVTACRSEIEQSQKPIPGVELSTFRRLSITAPKG